jgi:hypothetical protein
VVRWVVWSQVGFAIISTVASLADRGMAPRNWFPPGPILWLCMLSIFVQPIVVLVMGRRRPPGSGQLREAFASIALAVTTLFALFPMVQ